MLDLPGDGLLFCRQQAIALIVGVALFDIQARQDDLLAQDVAVVVTRPIGVIEAQERGIRAVGAEADLRRLQAGVEVGVLPLRVAEKHRTDGPVCGVLNTVRAIG